MPNQINDIKEANDKIRELQKTVSFLEKNNDKLRINGELKNEFISLATHQIRSPLGAIRGYTSLLLDGDYGEIPEKFIEPLNIILKSTDSLNKTVNDFLDVSRIEQGMMRYYMKDCDMHDLVLEVVDEFRINIKNKGLELHKGTQKGGQGKEKCKLYCTYCGRSGHTAERCWMRSNQKGSVHYYWIDDEDHQS